MALDPQHHRAFLVCEGNDLLTVFDVDAHKAIASFLVATGPDVAKFDPGLGTVLAQISRDSIAGRFPLAIWDAKTIRDGEVSVAFKTVDGSVDQAAGIVWRYRDPNNYYIVRANALENNVVLYKVENGVRLSIAPKRASVPIIRSQTSYSTRPMEHFENRVQGQRIHRLFQRGTAFRD